MSAKLKMYVNINTEAVNSSVILQYLNHELTVQRFS